MARERNAMTGKLRWHKMARNESQNAERRKACGLCQLHFSRSDATGGVYDEQKGEIATVAVRHCDPITQVSQK